MPSASSSPIICAHVGRLRLGERVDQHEAADSRLVQRRPQRQRAAHRLADDDDAPGALRQASRRRRRPRRSSPPTASRSMSLTSVPWPGSRGTSTCRPAPAIAAATPRIDDGLPVNPCRASTPPPSPPAAWENASAPARTGCSVTGGESLSDRRESLPRLRRTRTSAARSLASMPARTPRRSTRHVEAAAISAFGPALRHPAVLPARPVPRLAARAPRLGRPVLAVRRRLLRRRRAAVRAADPGVRAHAAVRRAANRPGTSCA